MPTLKCDSCGAPLKAVQGNHIAICEYCGAETVIDQPSAQNEQPKNNYNKATNQSFKKPKYKYLYLFFGFLIAAIVLEIIASNISTENGSVSYNGNSTSNNVTTNNNTPSEYSNALKQAESYSKTMHMSKKGIYDQLTSDHGGKFPSDAAQYAIDNIQADWNANALEQAKSYRKNMNMSNKAIYDQLSSENGGKFTNEEAQYAIDHLDN